MSFHRAKTLRLMNINQTQENAFDRIIDAVDPEFCVVAEITLRLQVIGGVIKPVEQKWSIT